MYFVTHLAELKMTAIDPMQALVRGGFMASVPHCASVPPLKRPTTACLLRILLLTIINMVRTPERLMTTEATLTSKGQTTIPKPIRDSLGMKTGDRMSFTLMPDGVVVMRVKNKRISDLAGMLYKKGRKRVPIELLSR